MSSVVTLNLLKERRFLPYFITQFSGAFNDSLIRRSVEMLIVSKQLSGSIKPDTAVFLLLALFMLPFFLFSAWGGFLADTMRKDRFVRAIKLVEVMVLVVAAFGLLTHSLFICSLSVFALGVHSAFFGPVKFSLPPQLVKKEELIAANGLIEAGTNLAILLGTLLGSLIILTPYGERYVSLIGLCIALSGLGSSLYLPEVGPTEATRGVKRISTCALLKLLFLDSRRWRISLGASWFWTLGAILISLFPLIVTNVLRYPSYFVSILFATFSLGVGSGSISCNRLLKGRVEGTWIPIAALGMALSLFVFYLLMNECSLHAVDKGVPNFFYSKEGFGMIGSLFFLSFFGGIFIVPLYGMLQSCTGDDDRSQVIAANNVMNASLLVAGSLLSALLSHLGVSLGAILLLLVFTNIFFAGYTTSLLSPKTRQRVQRFFLRS